MTRKTLQQYWQVGTISCIQKHTAANPPFLESGQDTRQDLDLAPELKATEFVKTWHHRTLSLRIWRPFKVITSNPKASRNPPDCHPRAPSAKRTKAKPRLCEHATTNQLMLLWLMATHQKSPLLLTEDIWPSNTSKPGILSNHWTRVIEPMGWLEMQICCVFFCKIPKREMVWRDYTSLLWRFQMSDMSKTHVFFMSICCKLSGGPTWLQHRQGLSLGPDEARELRSGNSRTSIQHDFWCNQLEWMA